MVPTKRDKGISIHPPREGRDAEFIGGELLLDISIHPPREGRDPG